MEVGESKSRGASAPIGDERTRRPGAEFTVPRLIAIEYVVQQTGAAGLGEEFRAETDQPPSRHQVVHADPTGSVIHHLLEATFAKRHQLRHHSEVVLRNIHSEALDRFVHGAVDRSRHHLRFPDRDFEAFSAHQLHEDRQLQFSSTLHLPCVRAFGRQHPNRHIADRFGVQSALDHRCGQLGSTTSARQR